MQRLWLEVQIGVRNVLQHRRRSLLLAAALGAVTTLLVLLGGLTAGIKDSMMLSATTLSTGHVNVGGFFKITAGQSAPLVKDYQRIREIITAQVPELEAVAARGRGWAKLVSDRGSTQAALAGLDVSREPRFETALSLISGSLEALKQPNSVLIFEEHLEKLDVKVGDAITVSAQTSRGTANTLDLRVGAIAKSVGLLSRFTVFVPSQVVNDLFQIRDDVTGALHLRLKREQLAAAPRVAAQLRSALAQEGYRLMDPDPRAYWMKFEAVNGEDWVGQKLDVTTWEDELSYISWILQLLQALFGVVLVILLLIVTGGIANTMWIAVRERTRELGTLRAIGASRSTLVRLVLIESIFLGVAAAAAGALLACLLGTGANALRIPVPATAQMLLLSEHIRFVLEPSAVLASVAALTALTALASVFPALRAARQRPVMAMAHFR
jgi:ABC-type lipoprotein release transport system permease subunit